VSTIKQSGEVDGDRAIGGQCLTKEAVHGLAAGAPA
jgi:hypothetical protein